MNQRMRRFGFRPLVYYHSACTTREINQVSYENGRPDVAASAAGAVTAPGEGRGVLFFDVFSSTRGAF